MRACVLSSLIVAFFHGSWFCCLRERETLCLFQGFLHMNCSRAWNSSDFRQMRFFWPSFHSSPLSFSFHVEMGPLAKKKLEEKGDRLSSWWKMLTFKYLLNRLHVSISTKLFKNHENVSFEFSCQNIVSFRISLLGYFSNKSQILPKHFFFLIKNLLWIFGIFKIQPP